MRLLAAFDKFRGTLSARAAGEAAARAAAVAGWDATVLPLADGGEGTLEVLGGANRQSEVTGPHGTPVAAAWRLHDGVAVIEMAQASGLTLAGGAEGNDPIEATTAGTGELIRAAIDMGATRIIVGLGGSATTDGGWGAVQAIGEVPGSVSIEVACDVTTTFMQAARVYGPQKGATDDQVALLTARLAGLRRTYRDLGLDVEQIPGSGAAGGLAGGLAALGADLRSGFDLVARELRLSAHVATADLVVTGEGRIDETSWQGKVVGGVAALAARQSVPLLVVAGSVVPGLVTPSGVTIATLVGLMGEEDAHRRPAQGVEAAVSEYLSSF